MANEAVVVASQENPWPFTVADGTGITKGALMELTTPRTANTADTSGAKFAGIAARDKVASDGRTELALHRRCMALVYCSGTINFGDPIVLADVSVYPNFVAMAGITASGANIIGHMLEAATNGQQKLAWIDVGCGSGAVS